MTKKYTKFASILKRLLYEHDIKPIDLARAVHLPPPTIHRFITGKSTRPYESSLKPIADYFSIEVAQLLGEKPLPFDETLGNTANKTELSETNQIAKILLIPWNKLENRTTTKEGNEIPFIGSISDKGFATIMPDSSMEPIIQRNAIVIFDPLITAKDRDYVLVKLHETKDYVLRQLLIDADHRYLKPLNPDLSAFKMRLLHKNDAIIASLVETRHNFQSNQDSAIIQE